MINQKRLVWADSLKGILIVLVVLGHSIQYSLMDGCYEDHVWNYIYSFHMPAFVAVSGFLSYRKSIVNDRFSIIYRRFKQLLVPYLLWELVHFSLQDNYTLSSLWNIFLHPYFWFLWVLFFIIVSFQCGDYLSEKLEIRQDVIILGLCFLFAALMVLGEIRIMGFQFIAYYFMFYAIGYFIHKYPWFVVQSNGFFLVLTVIWIFMAYYWNMHELPFFLKNLPLPSSALQYSYRFFTGFIAVYILLGWSPKLFDNNTFWNVPFVSLGKISLGIYVIHLLLIPYIVNLVEVSTKSLGVTIGLSFIIALTISSIIVWLIRKNRILAKLFLGKI